MKLGLNKTEVNKNINEILNNHLSDCGIYNMPAYPNSKCTCRPNGLLNKTDVRQLAKMVWISQYNMEELLLIAQHSYDIQTHERLEQGH